MKRSYKVLGIVVLAMFIYSLPIWAAEEGDAFIVVHDEASVNELIPLLTNGNGKAELEKNDVYKEDDDGKAALFVDALGGDHQRFNPNIPGWQIEIKDNPGQGEYRYLTWAWKKEGGAGIQLQLSVSGDWGFRYHAGVNEKGWNPSLEVDPDMPEDWTLVTRDVADDWGEITITGMAFSDHSLDFGIWDHVVFHPTEEDPLAPQAVEPEAKLSTTWGNLKRTNERMGK